MLARITSVTFLLAVCIGVASAQPAPKKADDKKLVTKVYNIKPLVGERGKAGGVPDTDAVVKLIFQTISFGEPKKVPQVIERDGGKLEIIATAEVHDEIKDLIIALERLQDLAIDVKAQAYELDPAAYEKLVKALPKQGRGKPGSPVLFAIPEGIEGDILDPEFEKLLGEANKVLKAGRLVQTSNGRYVNGAESPVSSRRSILRYTGNGAPAWKPTDNPLFVKEGFSLNATPIVSADRRFIRFKLTEQSTTIIGIKKREIGEINGQNVVLESPETEDLGGTGSATIPDGGTIIFKLAYAPKDKVWVVVLQPTIFIQAEEDALKGKKP